MSPSVCSALLDFFLPLFSDSPRGVFSSTREERGGDSQNEGEMDNTLLMTIVLLLALVVFGAGTAYIFYKMCGYMFGYGISMIILVATLAILCAHFDPDLYYAKIGVGVVRIYVLPLLGTASAALKTWVRGIAKKT